jgi:exonuclease SbcC
VRIIRVELENIKSYHHASIALRGGTTAIRGHNGAGKSTVVEAIGFALFDALSYKQAQFVREGERTGTVTVSFLSALDDREYEVVRRCGGSSDWYVYDPETGDRPAEQRADVIDFLRQHLRIEGEIELNALFTDALGVPQGAFTADFLLTPAQRKKKFDALLQVEDYRKAAEKLNDTRAYLVDQRHEQDRRVDSLERETGQLPEWRISLEEARGQTRELTARLERIEREAAAVGKQHEALRQQEAQVTRLFGEAQVAEATRKAAEDKLRVASEQLESARRAAEVCVATRADHAAFGHAETQMAQARERQRERDVLLSQRGAQAQQLEGERRGLQHQRAELEKARNAASRIIDLAPLVRRQSELEQTLGEARSRSEQLAEVERGLSRMRRDHKQGEEQIGALQRQIATLERQRPEAEQLAARREHLERLQAAAATRQAHEQRMQVAQREEQELRQKREQLTQRVTRARENVRKLTERQAEAERVPALEAEYAEVEREVSRLEAAIEQHRAWREQSGAGNCPFLREPCLNIQRRGENNLLSYFDRLIQRDEDALRPVRERLDALTTTLESAREIRRFYERLPEYQERQRQAQDDLAGVVAQIGRLDAEQGEIRAALAASPDVHTLEDARQQFQRSDEADRQLGRLPVLQEQEGQAQTQHAQLARELNELQKHETELAASRDQLQQADAALKELGDPRKQSAAYERIAGEKPQVEALVRQAEEQVQRIERQIASLDERLRPYATLDTELRELEATIQRTRAGHTRYLQHEQLAARLGEFEATHLQARQEAQQASAAHEHAIRTARTAQGAFNAEQYARVSQRAEELAGERGRTTQALQHMQEQTVHLEREIARVEALLEDLRAAREEREALEELEKMLQQFRETLKEAGPNILRALLKHISVEANRIFGDIMGDRSSQLSWEQDYEIVLRRDGRERSFAQLSGGEQMSAALAVRLALLRSLTRLDIAFFDEPTQNMDGERRSNLAEQIRRVRGFDQLIVISHDDTFEQGLDDVIHLEKHNGETQLIEDDALVTA